LFLGTIGHVAHGKSTLVKAISGVQVTEYSISHLMRNLVALKAFVVPP